MPKDSTPLRQGSRIYIEALSPEQLRHLGQPELPIRLTISGIIPDPTGERPPPVLELRFDEAMLADIEQQIQGLRPPAEPAPTDTEPPPEPLARRTPGKALEAELSPTQIAELRGSNRRSALSPAELERFLDGLRRMTVSTP
ncbi:hypothetical protein [Kitasatospora sp. NPDC088134]|uniref:hypothetical protein n=1 Tax=Kitasatospora sp. NPDC088134 TaxID=3364071 RepID=UPI00382ECDF1